MKLEELCLLDDTFDEDEEIALNELPRNAEGLQQLLDYIDSYDGSYAAWTTLFRDYRSLMSDGLYYRMIQKARKVWDI